MFVNVHNKKAFSTFSAKIQVKSFNSLALKNIEFSSLPTFDGIYLKKYMKINYIKILQST